MNHHHTTTTAARHSSASNEHYTPQQIIDLAWRLMEGIDLDPASSLVAQERVNAWDWCGLDHTDGNTNGLLKDWSDYGVDLNVFLNPPGGLCDEEGRAVIPKRGDTPACANSGACGLSPGHRHSGVRSSQKAWWQKLAKEYDSGHVFQAVFICFSVELLQTAQVDPVGSIPLDFPICFPEQRIAYLRPDGSVDKSPPHSSCIVYLPPKGESYDSSLREFRKFFGWFGRCR